MSSPVTGREWLRALPLFARRLKRDDPESYDAVMWMRNELLDAVARGDVDLSLPLLVQHVPGSAHVTFRNEAPRRRTA